MVQESHHVGEEVGQGLHEEETDTNDAMGMKKSSQFLLGLGTSQVMCNRITITNFICVRRK